MIKEIFFEDLPIGIIVNISMHRSKSYEKLTLVKIVHNTEKLTLQEVAKYYGSGHGLLTTAQKKLDPSTSMYAEAVQKARERVQKTAVIRYIFKFNDDRDNYVIIPITATTAQTTTITLPELNIFH